MLKKKVSLVLLSTFALALPFAARAQSESELVNQYTNLAGSTANAESLDHLHFCRSSTSL